MTLFDIIYRVSTDLTGLTKGVQETAAATDNIDKKLKQFKSDVEGFAQAFGLAFGGAAVVQGIRRAINMTLEYADALGKMKSATDISFKGLQELENIAVSTNTPLATLTNGILELSRRLATGDKNAAEAMKALKINTQDFLGLSGEEQFFTIARSMGSMADQTERNRLSFLLFGRSYKELLPALRADVDVLRDAVAKNTDTQIESLAQVRTQWELLELQIKRTTLEFVAFAQKWGTLQGTTATAGGFLRNTLGFGQPGMPTVNTPRPGFSGGTPTLEMPAPLGMPEMTPEKVRRVADAIEDGIQKVARAQEQAAKSAEKNAAAYRGMWNDIGMWQREAGALVQSWASMREMAAQVGGMIPGGGTPLELLGGQGREVAGQGLGMQNSLALRGGGQFTDQLNAFQRAISDLFGGATSAGGALENVLGNIGKGIFRSIGGMLTGGISSLISGGIELLGKGIGKLFGRDEESQQVNPLRDKFIAAAGGLGALNEKAAEAGVTLTALLKADTVKEYEAAITDLTKAFDFQAESMNVVRGAMEEFGLSVTDMGTAWSQQALDAKAADLATKFRALEAAGASVETISLKMGDALQQYVSDAIASGVTVPKAMHDIIQQAISQGLILDENGEAFENLEDTGLEFAENVEDATKTLTDAIRELTEAIQRGLGEAITNLPDVEVEANVHWNVPPMPNAPTEGAATGGLVTRYGIRHFAGGGWAPRGSDIIPAMLTPGELVLTAAHQEALATRLGRGGTVTVNTTVNAQGAFFDTPGSQQRLAERVSSALMSQLSRQQLFGLT